MLIKYAIISSGKPLQMTGAIEFKNKLNEFCKAHVHYHFQSYSTRDAIIKAVKIVCNKYDIECKGNKYLSCKPRTLDSFQKFFMYPLKQQISAKAHYEMCFGFSNTELVKMTEIANASYAITVEVANNRKDKHADSDTLFERLISHLDKTNEKDTDLLCQYTVEFYVKEDRPITWTTIDGYVTTYRLKKGYMTAAQYVAFKRST